MSQSGMKNGLEIYPNIKASIAIGNMFGSGTYYDNSPSKDSAQDKGKLQAWNFTL
jgi:hypothetical protein